MIKKACEHQMFDTYFTFDDEIDCAIISDRQFFDAYDKMDANAYEKTLPSEDTNVTDVTISYDDSIPEADMVDTDADDVIAAERDLAHHPFEDDEIIDSIVDEDDYNNINVREESI